MWPIIYENIIKNKITWLVLGLIIAILVLFFISPKAPETQPPTSTIQVFSTKVGSPATQVENLPNRKSKEQKDNQTLYSFPTIAETRDHLIITENNKVAFERVVTIESDYAHPSLTQMLQTLGIPEKEFKGSYYYGEEYITYIYASKGIAVVGNPLTDEVYEIHQFEPTTVEGYESKWGLDLHKFEGHQEETH